MSNIAMTKCKSVEEIKRLINERIDMYGRHIKERTAELKRKNMYRLIEEDRGINTWTSIAIELEAIQDKIVGNKT